jgi:hypothetical protein
VLDMNIPQFRATLRAIRRRESERQLRTLHAVFHAAAACVSGDTKGLDAETARLSAEASGMPAAGAKPRRSAFQSLLETARRDMASRGEQIPENTAPV